MPKLKIDLVVDDKGTLVVRGFGREVDRVVWSSGSAFRGLAREARVAGAALTAMTAAGGLVAAGVIGITDQYTSLESKLRLVTDSADELRSVQADLYRISQDSRQEYAGTVELYSRMARATRDTSISQHDMLVSTEAINKAMIISGATSQEASAAMIQLSQGLASNALRGDELRSVLEQTPRVARMVADGLGIAVGELRKWGKAGKLTTEAVINAITSQAAVINTEFAKVNVTVGQSRTVLVNTFKSIINDGGQAASITETLSGAILDFSDYLNDHRQELTDYFADGVEGAVDFMSVLGRLGQEGKPYLDSILTVSESIYDVAGRFADLGGPSTMEWGIIGYALLRGGPQAAAVTAALVTINNQLERYNLNLGSLKTSWQEYDQAMGNLAAVFRGEKDWNTGADLITSETDRIEHEITRLKESIAEAGDPVGDFFRKIFTGEEQSADQAAWIDSLQEKIGRLTVELEGVDQAYDDLGGTLGDYDWEGPAPAFLRVGEAAKKSKDDVCKANREKLTCTQRTTKKINAALDRMFDKEAADSKRAQEKLVRGYIESARGITDNWQIQARDREEVEARAMDAMIQLNGDATGEMENYWADFSENTKNILHDFVERSVKLEFDSIGDAFTSLLDSMLEMFIDWIAKMVANWAMSGLTELVINGSMDGFSLSSLFGGSSGGGGGALGMAYNAASLANTGSGMLGGPSTASLTAPISQYASGQLGLGSGTVGTNLAYGAHALYGAGTTGVGTVGSWYAGLQAAGNGVNAGTSLALIEGTYGPAAETIGAQIGATAGEEMAASMAGTTVDFSIDAAGGYAAAGSEAGASAGAGTAGWASAGWAALPLIAGAIWMGLENATDDKPAEQARKHWGLDTGARQYDLAADPVLVASRWTDQFQGVFDFATKGFGNLADMSHQLGASLDVDHVQQYVSTIAGVNVSMEQSANIMNLAHDAAQGNDAAFESLYQTLQVTMQATGDSTEYASATAYGLVEAMIDAGQATEATIGELNGITDSMVDQAMAADTLADAMVSAGVVTEDTADSISDAYGASEKAVEQYIQHMSGLDDEWYFASDVMDEVKAAASGGSSELQRLISELEGMGYSSSDASNAAIAMTNAVRQFSNTNLNLEATARLNVEIQGDANMSSSISGQAAVSSSNRYVHNYDYFDPYDPYGDAEGSALGGVVERPTWFTPFNYFGEAGPEAITPLRHPKQINHIEDKLDKLLGGRQSIENNIQLKIVLDGKELDARIIAVNSDHARQRQYRGEVTA